MSGIIDSLGQGFTDVISEFASYFQTPLIIQWLPNDLRIVLAATFVFLAIVAIKRGVFV